MEQTCGRHSCWSRQWLLAGYTGACLLAVLAGHAGAWLLVVLSDHAAACLLVVLAGCACFIAGIVSFLFYVGVSFSCVLEQPTHTYTLLIGISTGSHPCCCEDILGLEWGGVGVASRVR